MNIAPATLADLPALAALEREVFVSEIYPPFFFRQAHDLWPRWLLVARDDIANAGELRAAAPTRPAIQAYVLAAPTRDAAEAWILSAATAPAHRGRGLGSRLLTEILRALAQDGVRRVWLTVHPENPARRLYERHGFRQVAAEADYFGPDEPRWQMCLELAGIPLLPFGSMNISPLFTPRLCLRPVTVDDAPFALDLLNTPGWLRFIGDRGVRTLDDAKRYLETGALASYARHGFGLLAVEQRSDAQRVGLAGLLKRETLPDIELGFAFLPRFEGLGYASEAGAAVVSHARGALGIRRLTATVQPGNAASLRVLAKLGFNFERSIRPTPEGPELHLLALE